MDCFGLDGFTVLVGNGVRLMDEKNILKNKRTGFVERWAHAEEASAFLGITLYALVAFSIVLLVMVFKLSTREAAIYYIPGAQELISRLMLVCPSGKGKVTILLSLRLNQASASFKN